jgi:cleavage and polyadenylation specificity factor subunit 1
MCGTHLFRTVALHPAANGLVERFHWTLKAAIMCHADQQWTEALPLVLLGTRTSYKADLQVSVAEFVYGEPLRIPGELLTPTTEPVDPAHLITQLRRHMARLKPTTAARHASPAMFVHKDLHNCTHVFLRLDAYRRSQIPPYTGPYQVLSRNEKTFHLLVRRNPVTVSTGRVIPAYVLNKSAPGPSLFPSPTSIPPTTSTAPTPSSSPPPCTRRSGRNVRFPTRFIH